MSQELSTSVVSLMERIAEWHEQTFDTTCEAQWIKLKEEVIELCETESYSNYMEELADVVFVLSALIYRFKDDNAITFAKLVGAFLNPLISEDLYFYLSAKFNKNKARKWEKQPDGTYHHV